MKCPMCGYENKEGATYCLMCYKVLKEEEPEEFTTMKKMVAVTTPTIEGKRVVEYIGIVTGEAIVGVNIFKDISASIRDIVGGRSASYERELLDAQRIAVEEMKKRALIRGANAIIGVDLDYETIGAMLMVTVSGTAVKVE